MLVEFSYRKILLLFVLTLYFLLLSSKLMRLGIHADGLEYANVARNMAEGLGTFWNPYHDDLLHPVFHEHPPLVFWIQSFFFKLFGEGPYFESFYGLLVGLVIFGMRNQDKMEYSKKNKKIMGKFTSQVKGFFGKLF